MTIIKEKINNIFINDPQNNETNERQVEIEIRVIKKCLCLRCNNCCKKCCEKINNYKSFCKLIFIILLAIFFLILFIVLPGRFVIVYY